MRREVVYTRRLGKPAEGEVFTVKSGTLAYEIDTARLLRFLGTAGLTAYDVKANFGLPYAVAYAACERLRRSGKVRTSIGNGCRGEARYYEAVEEVA